MAIDFDYYVFAAVGLFVVGLFAIMVYERINPRTRLKTDDSKSSKQAEDIE